MEELISKVEQKNTQFVKLEEENTLKQEELMKLRVKAKALEKEMKSLTQAEEEPEQDKDQTVME
jgi:beta-N-acetylglucosaminidase